MRTIGHEVIISRDDVPMKKKYEQRVEGRSVQFHDLELASDILKKYGSALRWISIRRFYPHTNGTDDVSHLINQYASENLKHLSMGYVTFDTFQQYTASFSKIEHVTFIVQTEKILSGTAPLNKIFPNVSFLSMVLKSSVDYSFIDCEFPRLKQLYLDGSSDALKHLNQIENFLCKNSQIKILRVESVSGDFIRMVNSVLTNLERFEVDNFDVGVNTTRFGSVRKFTVWELNHNSIRHLSMPKLDSVELRYSPEDHNAWIEFFSRHSNVSDLYIFHPLSWNTVPLVALTANLKNLATFRLGCTNFIKFEALSQFIDDHERLMRLQFSKYRFNDEDLVKLRDRFESEWSFQLPYDEWILERLQ